MMKALTYLLDKAYEWQKWIAGILVEAIKKYWLGLALCLVAMIVLDYFFGSVCFSLLFFGIPCPGCGMTRAAKLMLTGHFRESFHMHPLLLLVVIGIIGYPIIKKILKKYILIIKLYVIICIVIFIGVYIYRMNLYYPDIEPMVYYKDNYLHRVMLLLHNSGLVK
ncbi:MAG TPA: DUF2752 domain-containing protein [Clostridiales bacterium]|nr:DUF2752 domain-containing protein [Clostridiales bacterium]